MFRYTLKIPPLDASGLQRDPNQWSSSVSPKISPKGNFYIPEIMHLIVKIINKIFWRRVPESNRCTRICNPLHNHSTNPPLCLQTLVLGQSFALLSPWLCRHLKADQVICGVIVFFAALVQSAIVLFGACWCSHQSGPLWSRACS